MSAHATVAEAMADSRLAAFVETLMRRDIAASLTPAAGLDLLAYIGQCAGPLPQPGHRPSVVLDQAWDGSQKLPFRLLQIERLLRPRRRPACRAPWS